MARKKITTFQTFWEFHKKIKKFLSGVTDPIQF
jgi:hypothetical protein